MNAGRIQWATMALLALTSLPLAANADLIDLGATTFDDVTGLEWLDLTETQNFSIRSIRDGDGGFLADGWTVANDTEVCGLFGNAGNLDQTACTGSGPSFGNWYMFTSGPESQSVIDLLGNTSADLRHRWVLGTFGGTTAGRSGYACLFADGRPCASTGSPGGFVIDDYWSTENYRSASAGVYLVREASVPEPAALLLLGLGLVGIAGRRRKKV